MLRTTAALLPALVLTSGCVTSRVDTAFTNRMSVGEGEEVVIIARRQDAETETESGFVDCVKKAMARGDNPVMLGSEVDFIDQLFPWFEPRVAPLSDDNLPELLAKPGVADKVLTSGVRYVIWLDGSTELVDGGGQLSCDINIGCFGFNWWEKGANYEAAIWDLHKAESTGIITADVTGRSYMPAVVVPIPLIARTQAAACKGIAGSLKQFLN